MPAFALHPVDVPVALQLALAPDETFAQMALPLGLSASTVHAAIGRLKAAGLVRPDADRARAVNRSALLEFLEHGVRYAFPGVVGGAVRGVPTAHSGPALAREILAEDGVVWPAANGKATGLSLDPLLPKSGELPSRAPALYAMLTAVDAVRIGRARERQIAMRYLRERLKPGAAVPNDLT